MTLTEKSPSQTNARRTVVIAALFFALVGVASVLLTANQPDFSHDPMGSGTGYLLSISPLILLTVPALFLYLKTSVSAAWFLFFIGLVMVVFTGLASTAIVLNWTASKHPLSPAAWTPILTTIGWVILTVMAWRAILATKLLRKGMPT